MIMKRPLTHFSTLLFSILVLSSFTAWSQKEFTGTGGAISPLTAVPVPPLPNPPLPVPNPLPPLGDVLPVNNEYTCTVSEYGQIPLNALQKVKIDITYTDVSALKIQLVSPLGTVLTLVDTLPNGGSNFTDTEFVLDSAESITTGTAPYTGRFLPTQTPPGLNNFLFENANGEWKLVITPTGIEGTPVAEPGTVNSWSMVFKDEDTVASVNNKIAAKSFLRVYPNPSNIAQSTSVQVSESIGFPYTIEVINAIGQVVLSKQEHTSISELSGIELSEGLYQIRVSGSQQRGSMPLLINR